MTFEAAELILPQPYICRNASAKVCYILCKLHTYLNHPHSPSFLNPFEVLMLFSFIISCQCVKQCGGVGGAGGWMWVTASEATSGQAADICARSKIILMTPNCLLIVIFKWPDVRLQSWAVFSGTLQSAQQQRIHLSLPSPDRQKHRTEALSWDIFASLIGLELSFFRFTHARMGCSSLWNYKPESYKMWCL